MSGDDKHGAEPVGTGTMFHWRDFIFFGMKDDGTVRIKQYANQPASPPWADEPEHQIGMVFDISIPPDEWMSILGFTAPWLIKDRKSIVAMTGLLADARRERDTARSSTRRTEPMKYLEGISDLPGLVEALGDQKQCDEDGVLCEVSRQAVEEARTVLGRMVKDQESIWCGEAVPSATLPPADPERDSLMKDAARYRYLKDNRRLLNITIEEFYPQKQTCNGDRADDVVDWHMKNNPISRADGSTNG